MLQIKFGRRWNAALQGYRLLVREGGVPPPPCFATEEKVGLLPRPVRNPPSRRRYGAAGERGEGKGRGAARLRRSWRNRANPVEPARNIGVGIGFGIQVICPRARRPERGPLVRGRNVSAVFHQKTLAGGGAVSDSRGGAGSGDRRDRNSR